MKELFKSDILRNSKEFDLKGCYVYFLIDSDEIVYIGYTSNYMARLVSHATTKKFDRYLLVKSKDENHGLILEKFYINKFQPKYNVKDVEDVFVPKIARLSKSVIKKIKDAEIVEAIKEENPGIILAEKTDIKFQVPPNTYSTKVIDNKRYYFFNLKSKLYKADFVIGARYLIEKNIYAFDKTFGDLESSIVPRETFL